MRRPCHAIRDGSTRLRSAAAGVILLALALAACSDSGGGPSQGNLTSRQQASTTDDSTEIADPQPAGADSQIARAKEATAPSSSHFEGPPDFAGPQQLPEPSAKRDQCPLDKLKRKDWDALRASKEAHIEALAPSRDDSAALPAPSQELLDRQQRFLDAVASQRSQLDALPQEDRDRAYEELKQRMLGE